MSKTTTAETIQKRIAELQARRDLLEVEARQHEAAAKEKRTERDGVKADLAELVANHHQLLQTQQAQRAAQSAERAQELAESRATELGAGLEALARARADLDARMAALDDKEAKLDAKLAAAGD